MSVTYEEQRTEQEKRIDADVLARVKRGLAWLVYGDEAPQGWTGYDHAMLLVPERNTIGHGHGEFGPLQEAWEFVLRPRVTEQP